MTRPWIVLVRSGRRAGIRAILPAGGELRVGRETPCDMVIPEDRDLSDIHFTLTARGDTVELESVAKGDETSGVDVNGQRTSSIALSHGDWIRAGSSHFSIYRERHTPPLDDVIETPEKRAALDALRGLAAPTAASSGGRGDRPVRLFALLDAARDERVLQIVRERSEEARSLYDGFQGEILAEAAPYLVDCGTGPLLDEIVLEGWGKSWAVFVGSTRPFVEVRRHFRRYLIVQDDETEERLYFRFYDPRVLRVFLPLCTRRQLGDMLGELSFLAMEDEEGGLVRFSKGEGAAARAEAEGAA